MISLPNGCTCTDIKVTPSSWDKPGASTKKTWRIYYRFYDPAEKPLLVELKVGINYIKDLKERRAAVKKIIEAELFRLKEQGYNPITRTYTTPLELVYEIDPETPFIIAIKKSITYLSVSQKVKVDMNAAIKVMERASVALGINKMPVNKVSIRYLTVLMSKCGEINPHWSARRHNMYRSYLIMVYKKLVKLETVLGNPALSLDRLKEFKKLKVVATKEQRERINNYLKANEPRFWHFVNLFFHSGGRKTELVQLTPAHVDLVNQKYRCVVRKGYKEVERTIKDVAVKHWEVFLKDCPQDYYLFGTDFLPAKRPMCADTPTRWWKRTVKDVLGINVDFYSLKHLHTDEMAATLGLEDAAKHNEHSEKIAGEVYAVGESERRHERIKKVSNIF